LSGLKMTMAKKTQTIDARDRTKTTTFTRKVGLKTSTAVDTLIWHVDVTMDQVSMLLNFFFFATDEEAN
jgi:hypothetical protein